MNGNDDFTLRDDHTVEEYRCGLKAGALVMLKQDVHEETVTGQKTGRVWHRGGVWRVLKGSVADNSVVFLLTPSGERHTWDDDISIYDTFQLLE